jgi:hypothetical protein
MEGTTLNNKIIELYYRIKREPDGSLGDAIKAHAQACGFIAFLLDLHPDRVAEAIAEAKQPDDDEQLVRRFITSVYETWGAYAGNPLNEERMKESRDEALAALDRLLRKERP